MITGKLTVHSEEEPKTFTASNSEDYWNEWYNDGSPFYRRGYSTPPPKVLENLIEEEVTNALSKGFHIGARVTRNLTSYSKAHGTVMHFDKSEKAYRPYNERVEVICVKFDDVASVVSYHTDELKLVEGETQ